MPLHMLEGMYGFPDAGMVGGVHLVLLARVALVAVALDSNNLLLF
jgi:hypothetical protein